MKRNHCLAPLTFAIVIACTSTTAIHSQGLQGYPESPSPRGGTSAGGPLLPGKSDDERWAFLQSQERKLFGKTKSEIIKLVEKKGGPGLTHNSFVYQVTQGHPRKPGSVAHVDLEIKFDDNDTVSAFTLEEVKWL